MRHAMETREYGLRQRISGRTAEDKRRVAYHEAGHAIAMLRLYTRKRLDRLTLMQYGELRGAEGVAFDKAKEEIHITTKEELLVDIQIYLASKAAEIVFLGTETTGMGGDLPGASYRAVQYVRCGMGGQLFTMWGEMPTPDERRQAERVMQQQFSAARKLVEENKPQVHAIVEALLEKEELLGDEVEEIVARVDREDGRTSGRVVDLPTPPQQPALPAPEAQPSVAAASVRYAGARRPSEERDRERGDHGVAYRDVTSSTTPPASEADTQS
jgi:ATP-dependent Zn protease